MFKGRTIVLAVTGSVSAYKAVELVGELVKEGAEVEVVMTEAATKFISPLSFSSITHRLVHTDMWAPDSKIQHVTLAERGDVTVVAPATANTIAKIAIGLADNLVTSTVLATKSPVIVAPAMNEGMYQNKATQENLEKLRLRGYIIIGPAYGKLASGKEGIGRLAEIEELKASILQVLTTSSDLSGRRLIVTAGGTKEPIDAVRYIGNYSSGKMGYQVAEAARKRGAEVSIISAPSSLPPPPVAEIKWVQTAEQMRDAVMGKAASADALVMAAAVADYRPREFAQGKIKREEGELSLKLEATPDILSEVKENLIKVGFAAETEDLIGNAKKKLKSKDLDLIVANDITAPESGFGSDNCKVTIIDRQGKIEDLPLMPKSEVAHKLLDRVVELLSEKDKG